MSGTVSVIGSASFTLTPGKGSTRAVVLAMTESGKTARGKTIIVGQPYTPPLFEWLIRCDVSLAVFRSVIDSVATQQQNLANKNPGQFYTVEDRYWYTDATSAALNNRIDITPLSMTGGYKFISTKGVLEVVDYSYLNPFKGTDLTVRLDLRIKEVA